MSRPNWTLDPWKWVFYAIAIWAAIQGYVSWWVVGLFALHDIEIKFTFHG